MSYSCIASAEFTNLCQSQMTLLNQGLGAVWSAVYLTEGINEDWQANLIPVAVYPQQDRNYLPELPTVRLSEIWQQLTNESFIPLLPTTQKMETFSSTNKWEKKSEAIKKLILPLIYEDTVLGLLVTGRNDRDWHQRELKQIEGIARSLAIARFIEIKYEWSQKQLIAEENLRHIEQDRLDDLLHQLRNPLTAIKTFSKLLIKRLLPEDRNYSVAQSILTQSDRFSELLEQFEKEMKSSQENSFSPGLNSSSVPLLTEDSKVKNNFLLPESETVLQPIAVTEILEPLLVTTSAIAQEKNIDLEAKIPENIPPVAANFKALREVLNNLIDNALKYTPAGGRIVIEIQRERLKDHNPLLGIGIKDTGYGINQEDHDRIFERHYRGIQAQGDIPGSGLGLAIAQELVQQMGGKIELISPNNLAHDALSPGTTFIVWLPLFSQQ